VEVEELLLGEPGCQVQKCHLLTSFFSVLLLGGVHVLVIWVRRFGLSGFFSDWLQKQLSGQAIFSLEWALFSLPLYFLQCLGNRIFTVVLGLTGNEGGVSCLWSKSLPSGFCVEAKEVKGYTRWVPEEESRVLSRSFPESMSSFLNCGF
jgi:hypothetical protein